MKLVKIIISILIIVIIIFFIKEFIEHKIVFPFNYDRIVK